MLRFGSDFNICACVCVGVYVRRELKKEYASEVHQSEKSLRKTIRIYRLSDPTNASRLNKIQKSHFFLLQAMARLELFTISVIGLILAISLQQGW